jgi:hypothetical protein
MTGCAVATCLLVRPDAIVRWHRDLINRRHAAKSTPKWSAPEVLRGLTVRLVVCWFSGVGVGDVEIADEVEDLFGAAAEPDLVFVAVLARNVDGRSPSVG